MNRDGRILRACQYLRLHGMLYLFLIPALAYIAIFNYGPLYGIQIAFKNFSPAKGIWGSPWAGDKWFAYFFQSPRFGELIWNTASLSLYSIIAGYPLPIFLAVTLHYLKSARYRKFAQTVTYMPYFISTVVLVGMMSMFFSPQSGFVNAIIRFLGGESIYFLGQPKWFRHLYVWSGVWQSTGYNAIIYIAALTCVSPDLHESALLDGASRLQRIAHIDIPTILPTMMILLVLNLSNILSVGFEKVYLMQNNLTLGVSEVISTYVYKTGVFDNQYSFSTAIGLFNNGINFILLVIANWITRRLSGYGLW